MMLQKHTNLCTFVERINSKYMGVSLGIFSRRIQEDKEKDKADANKADAGSTKPQRSNKEK
jgi:hypothetical protein